MSTCPTGYTKDAQNMCRNAEGFAPPVVIPAPNRCNTGYDAHGNPCNLRAFDMVNTSHPLATLKIPVSAFECGAGAAWDPEDKGCHCKRETETWFWDKDPSKMGCRTTTTPGTPTPTPRPSTPSA